MKMFDDPIGYISDSELIVAIAAADVWPGGNRSKQVVRQAAGW